MSEYLVSGRQPKPGQDIPVKVDIVSGTITGSNGAILDGADSNIKASVLDYTNSNPLAVRLTDTNGDYVSGGGGTEYTEDAAAAANPVGGAIIVVRDDARAGSLTTTDGDNVALRGTNAGELYVKHVDAVPITDNSGSITVDNGGTFAVQAAQSGTWNVTDISGTVSLPTGAATAANQSTIIGHVDGIETLLGTIDADTGNIATNTTDLPNVIGTDGATGPSKAVSIAGTQSDGTLQEIQVDADGQLQIDVASSALPSGAATAANQTTIIGHVDGIEGLLTTIDADTSALVGVDYATQTTLAAINAKLVTGTDIGDVTINNASGGSAVNIQDGGNSITVDNAGTFAVQNTPVLATSSSASTPASAVSVATSSTTIIAANASRKFFSMRNAGTEVIYFRLASSGATTSDMPLYPQDYFELPQMNIYTGAIVGISAGTTQSIRIMEY